MKKTLTVLIILAMVIALTSCGSKKNSVNTSSSPAKNEKTSVTTKKSIDSINNTMKSVETSVDSIEDAVDINTDNL